MRVQNVGTATSLVFYLEIPNHNLDENYKKIAFAQITVLRILKGRQSIERMWRC